MKTFMLLVSVMSLEPQVHDVLKIGPMEEPVCRIMEIQIQNPHLLPAEFKLRLSPNVVVKGAKCEQVQNPYPD